MIFPSGSIKINKAFVWLVVLTFGFQFPPPKIQAIKNFKLNEAIHV